MDAYLVRDWLVRNDIAVWMRGESLMSVRGDVPIGMAWPAVWVDKADEGRATDALKTFHGPVLVHPDWSCRCGETNAPSFASCWSCGRDQPGTPDIPRAL